MSAWAATIRMGWCTTAWDYAINTKAKLVVAAAGNDARSATMDWAHEDHPDWRNHPGVLTPPAGRIATWVGKTLTVAGWPYNPDNDLNTAE